MKIHKICLDNTDLTVNYSSMYMILFVMERSDLVMFHQKSHNSVFW